MSEIKKDFKKEMQEDYPLIPMGEITDEARILAKTWYDGVSEMNNIWDKHKLASDIMNYARRFAMSPEARRMNGGELNSADDIVSKIYKAYGTDSGILFGIREKEIVKAIVEFTLNRLYEPPVE